MTLRQVFRLAQGRLRADRSLIVASAALAFATVSKENVEKFIQTGELIVSDAREDVIPYDQTALKTMVENGLLRGMKAGGASGEK